MNTVGIVDTGGANIASVRHALRRLGHQTQLIDNAGQLARASRVILPGVGAAGEAMERLHAHDLIDALRAHQRPVLGICLGMQLLCERTDEDARSCLDIISGKVTRLTGAPTLPVPHMGWSKVCATGKSVLLTGIPDESYFYFVHSYALVASEQTEAVSHYGVAFASVVEHENFYGTQFHPEKSSVQGASLLNNFLSRT